MNCDVHLSLTLASALILHWSDEPAYLSLHVKHIQSSVVLTSWHIMEPIAPCFLRASLLKQDGVVQKIGVEDGGAMTDLSDVKTILAAL
jgi:hypothetical protein